MQTKTLVTASVKPSQNLSRKVYKMLNFIVCIF